MNRKAIDVFEKSTSRFGALLHEFFPEPEKIVGVEIGVFRGDHAVKMLRSHGLLRLTGVDLWEEHITRKSSYLASPGTLPSKLADMEYARDAHHTAENKLHPFGERAALLQLSSEEASTRFHPASLDFVYIDADHSYPGCLKDIELWWPKIKCGGVLAGHDYHWDDVRRAVDYFFPIGVHSNSASDRDGKCWVTVK